MSLRDRAGGVAVSDRAGTEVFLVRLGSARRSTSIVQRLAEGSDGLQGGRVSEREPL